MDFWEQPNDFGTWNHAPTEGAPSHLRMTWSDGDTTAQARVEKIGPALRVTEFTLRAATGVPAPVRRLPSDGMVVQLLRRAGNPGISAMVEVLDDYDGLSAVIDQVRTSAEHQGVEFDLESALSQYAREFQKRPKSKMSAEIAQVAEWLHAGWGTKEIVEELRARGVAERTAYRRLSKARSCIVSSEAERSRPGHSDD